MITTYIKDKKIHDKLFEYAQGKTLLVITHRLENIDQYDRIIVMEKGKVVENASPEELRLSKSSFLNKGEL